MNAKKLFAAAAMLVPMAAAPGLAQANEQGHIDAYYIPYSSLDFKIDGLGSTDGDGDGFGVKGMVPLGATRSFFLEGEYQSSKNDDFDFDIDQTRFGAGWQTPLSTGTFALYGEYADIEIDNGSADGLGVHGRLTLPIAPAVNLYGQIGYLWLEDEDNIDIDGVEFLIGASVDFNPNVGAFIDFRQDNLTSDDPAGDVDFTFQDLRVGVRVLF